MDAYTINPLTGLYRRRHRNQLWRRHRPDRGFQPDDEMYARQARNVAFIALCCSRELLQLLNPIAVLAFNAVTVNAQRREQITMLVRAQQRLDDLIHARDPQRAAQIRNITRQIFASNLRASLNHQFMWVSVRNRIVALLVQFMKLVGGMLRLDSVLMDIPPLVEAGRYALPLQNIRLWQYENMPHSTQKIEEMYRYNAAEIRQLLAKLQLRQNCRIDRGNGRYYVFNSEELLLYSLERCAQGHEHTDMRRKYGGDDSRWRVGYQSLLRHTLGLYGHRLSIIPGLAYLCNFELFVQYAAAIRAQANRQRLYYTKYGQLLYVFPGGGFGNNFNVVGFVDCKNHQTTRWGAGPQGQEGTVRRPDADLKQQSIFAGDKHHHAIKPLALVLACGLAFLFGPVSARRNENRVLDWRHADQYLHTLYWAMGFPHPFVFYGDQAFRGARLHFRTRHEPLIPGVPLPLNLSLENHAMKIVRESHEHYYALLYNLWHLASAKYLLKISRDAQIVSDEIRFMHLLTNIYSCSRGNNVSKHFGLPRPSVDQYLSP